MVVYGLHQYAPVVVPVDVDDVPSWKWNRVKIGYRLPRRVYNDASVNRKGDAVDFPGISSPSIAQSSRRCFLAFACTDHRGGVQVRPGPVGVRAASSIGSSGAAAAVYNQWRDRVADS